MPKALAKVASNKRLDVKVKTRRNKVPKQTIPKLPEAHVKNEPYKKKPIPQALRIAVWEKYNKNKYDVKCPIAWCNCRITPFTFEAGHNIPEKFGGETTLENLMPICASCNRSMGCKYTIDEFSSLFIPKKEIRHNKVYPIETQPSPIDPRFLPQMEDDEQSDEETQSTVCTTKNTLQEVVENVPKVSVNSGGVHKTEITQQELQPKKRWWQSLFKIFSH